LKRQRSRAIVRVAETLEFRHGPSVLEPKATVQATWALELGADIELEVAVDDEGFAVCDASRPLCELRPSRSRPGGELWASAQLERDGADSPGAVPTTAARTQTERAA
jgi:hypothetical protein